MTTEGTRATQPPSSSNDKQRHQRSAKNYLLDRRFQLKYTFYLIGIAALISLALGFIILRTSSAVMEQNGRAVTLGLELVEQGRATVDRGTQVIEQSRKVSKVVAMNIAKEYADDPELAKAFQEATSMDEKALNEEQARLEADAASITRQAEELRIQSKDLEEQQRALLVGIVVALLLLVVALGVAGIIMTHKVAGPIYKMKRLLKQVGEGQLVMRERLRKGDELVHFFETFEKMVNDLRRRQSSEIAKVDLILQRLDDAPRSQGGNREFDDDGVALLKKLRQEMQEQLDG